MFSATDLATAFACSVVIRECLIAPAHNNQKQMHVRISSTPVRIIQITLHFRLRPPHRGISGIIKVCCSARLA